MVGRAHHHCHPIIAIARPALFAGLVGHRRDNDARQVTVKIDLELRPALVGLEGDPLRQNPYGVVGMFAEPLVAERGRELRRPLLAI